MKKIVFSLLLGFAAIKASADFVQLPGHFGGSYSDPTWTLAEDFQFAQSSSVGTLVWWGGFEFPRPGADAFIIRLYADSGGHPGGLLSGFDVGPITGTATGSFVLDGGPTYPPNTPEFRYSAHLQTPFVAQAGTKYWLSIIYSVPDLDYVWEASVRTDINSGVQRSFNGGPWQPFYDRTAMQLVVVPEPSCAALFLAGATGGWILIKRGRRAAV
jgi:hypothetical protein